jgi:hypothetical protein
MANIKADLGKLRRNADASAVELREFLAEMRGKSPREMLGTVATSNLGKSLIQAVGGVAVAIILFTLVPFAFNKMTASEKSTEPPQEQALSSPATASPTKQPTPAEPPLNPDAKPGQVLDKLGIGESRKAPLSVNPLENSSDDILKDLK